LRDRAAKKGRRTARPSGKSTRRRRPAFQIRLTRMELLGLGVVAFCLFLWMFLLGIWAGQTILLPGVRGAAGVPAPLPYSMPRLSPEGRKHRVDGTRR